MSTLYRDPPVATNLPATGLAAASAVSWGAVLAGAVAAAAFGLILLTLGSGLGLSSLSPWSAARRNASVFGFAAIVWVCVTQIMTCGLGGYLAGRLRARWGAMHHDETYFRDTAHGFLVWAVATLLTAGVLGAALGSLTHAGAQAGAAVMNSALAGGSGETGGADASGRSTEPWPLGYLVDSLFRAPAGMPASATPSTSPQATALVPRAEVGRILMNSAMTGSPLAPNDSEYLAQLVSQHTGLRMEDARARVSFTYAELTRKLQAIDDAARVAADKARRVAIHVALWLFISMLMGAFSASLMATHGGRVRDTIE